MNEVICYKVIEVDCEGITLEYNNSDVRVNFQDCVKNSAMENILETSMCVATRDITELSFTFYTIPKTKIIFKKNFLIDIFSRKKATNRFFELKNKINQFGYTSYDLS